MFKILPFSNIFSRLLNPIFFSARTIKYKLPPPPFPSLPKIPQTLSQIQNNQPTISNEKVEKLPKKLRRNLTLRKLAEQELKDEMYPQPEKNFVYLPQTQDFEEIVAYFQKFKKILKEPQYLILMSRIAHLKNVKEHNLDPRLFEIIRKVCTLNLRTSPKYISNFIKYAAMIGSHDKMLWRKLTSELYKTDFKKNLTEFSLSLNYLQVHGVLNKTLLDFMQEKAVEILDQNVDNQSFKIMELLLNSLKNFKINPELLTAILKRLRLHIHTMPLKNLRNSFIPAVQMKLDDEGLWDLYRKWIYLRMNTAKKEGSWEEIRENYSYLVFTYAKTVDEGLIKNFKEKFDGDEYKELKSLLYEVFEFEKENSFYKSNGAHFIRVFKAFVLFAVNYVRNEDVKNIEFLINYLMGCDQLKENLKIKDYLEIFMCLVRVNDLYKPFDKHSNLLMFLHEKLMSRSFELPVMAFKKISDFLFDERNKSLSEQKELMGKVLLKMRENLISIVGLRGINNEVDKVTIETIVERFKMEGMMDAESYDLVGKGLKRNVGYH